MNTPIVLVAGADAAYTVPLGVTLFSAVRRLPKSQRVEVHVVDGGLATHERVLVKQTVGGAHPRVDVAWHRDDSDDLRGLTGKNHVSAAAYLRLLIPRMVPGDRALYLDSDLVVQRDLSDLWETDLEGATVGAVRDEQIPTLGAAGLPRAPENAQAAYFNSGVLLMDLRAWRSRSVSERVLADLRAYGDQYRMTDQDALNESLSGDWRALDPRWNVQVFRSAQAAAPLPSGEAFILHYTTGSKPWTHVSRVHATRAYHAAWHRELRASGMVGPSGRAWRLVSRAARTVSKGWSSRRRAVSTP